MFALAAAALVLTGACKDACVHHVADPHLKATVCGRCFTQGDRGAWAAALGPYVKEVPDKQLEGLLDDDDWAVRWGGIKSLAFRKQQTESNVLSDWVDRSPAVKACATVVHVSGAKHEAASAFLRPGSAATCWERRATLRSALELGLYDLNLGTRLETLQHLSAYFEKPPARIVLDAMKTRAVDTDALSASVLEEGAAPVGKAMLDVAKTDADGPLMNRLLAIFSKEIDGLRAKLKDPDPAVRRETIRALGDLAPLSGPELEAALDDEDGSNRRNAAVALARGEGMQLAAYARRKLEPSTAPASSIKWLGFIGASREPTCRTAIEQALHDERLDMSVRAAAPLALVDCMGKAALPTVGPLLDSPDPQLRAGATRALSALPRSPDVIPLLERRFTDSDARVLIAAAAAAGPTHERRLLSGLTRLTQNREAGVRVAAVAAIAQLGDAATVPLLAKLLAADPDVSVRVACALALGNLGGSGALPSLVAASESDKDANVKFVAGESLRKLGFQRSAGSMSP